MQEVILGSPEYEEKFRRSPYYVHKEIINAVHVSQLELEKGLYRHLDVHLDASSGHYVIDTYSTDFVSSIDGTKTVRVAHKIATHSVHDGDWIVTKRQMLSNDHAYNIVMSAESFRHHYDPTGTYGTYRRAGLFKIIKNDTGDAVRAQVGPEMYQSGDADCYFVASCLKNNLDHFKENGFEVISATKFSSYELADDAFGLGWRQRPMPAWR